MLNPSAHCVGPRERARTSTIASWSRKTSSGRRLPDSPRCGRLHSPGGQTEAAHETTASGESAVIAALRRQLREQATRDDREAQALRLQVSNQN